MTASLPRRVASLTSIFALEQIREPLSLIWTIISPAALFYLLSYNRNSAALLDYTLATAWFYAYIASSVAFFGFCFYLIGRRESGFVRSFMHTRTAKAVFLASHFISYSLVSLLYACAFYLITKPAFGPYDLQEAVSLTLRFYVCFLGFCTPALLLANARLKFQTANTLISVLLFCGIMTALMGTQAGSPTVQWFTALNPFVVAKRVMEASQVPFVALGCSAALLLGAALVTIKTFRTNPVWSRY